MEGVSFLMIMMNSYWSHMFGIDNYYGRESTFGTCAAVEGVEVGRLYTWGPGAGLIHT